MGVLRLHQNDLPTAFLNCFFLFVYLWFMPYTIRWRILSLKVHFLLKNSCTMGRTEADSSKPYAWPNAPCTRCARSCRSPIYKTSSSAPSPWRCNRRSNLHLVLDPSISRRRRRSRRLHFWELVPYLSSILPRFVVWQPVWSRLGRRPSCGSSRGRQLCRGAPECLRAGSR